MDDDTRNLLARVGQPDFAYRDYPGGDDADDPDRWPLLRRVAALVRPSVVPIGQGRQGGSGGRGTIGAIGAILAPYAAAGERPGPAIRQDAAGRAQDVRALLGRLAAERR